MLLREYGRSLGRSASAIGLPCTLLIVTLASVSWYTTAWGVHTFLTSGEPTALTLIVSFTISVVVQLVVLDFAFKVGREGLSIRDVLIFTIATGFSMYFSYCGIYDQVARPYLEQSRAPRYRTALCSYLRDVSRAAASAAAILDEAVVEATTNRTIEKETGLSSRSSCLLVAVWSSSPPELVLSEGGEGHIYQWYTTQIENCTTRLERVETFRSKVEATSGTLCAAKESGAGPAREQEQPGVAEVSAVYGSLLADRDLGLVTEVLATCGRDAGAVLRDEVLETATQYRMDDTPVQRLVRPVHVLTATLAEVRRGSGGEGVREGAVVVVICAAVAVFLDLIPYLLSLLFPSIDCDDLERELLAAVRDCGLAEPQEFMRQLGRYVVLRRGRYSVIDLKDIGPGMRPAALRVFRALQQAGYLRRRWFGNRLVGPAELRQLLASGPAFRAGERRRP